MVSIFGPPVRETERVREAFADDERAWELIGFGARLLTGVAVTGWLFSIFDWPAAVYYTAFVVTLVLIGYGHIRVTALHKRRVPLRALLITLDFALLTIAILFSNPLADWELPARMRLEIGTFDFYFVLLVSIGLTYSALRVFWAGLMAAACWSAAVCWVLQRPGVKTMFDHPMSSGSEWVQMRADPMFVDLGVVLEQLIIIILVTAFLIVAVTRARRLVQWQVDNDRKRQNLARYLSPLIAERLEDRDNPLAEPDEQPAAILFADLRGFTSWAAAHEPPEVFGTLSELMAMLTRDVFANRGTLDKYAGDGVMASFGTPDVTDEDSVTRWRRDHPT